MRRNPAERLRGVPPLVVAVVAVVFAAALGAIAADEAANATLLAVREAYPAPDGWSRVGAVAYS